MAVTATPCPPTSLLVGAAAALLAVTMVTAAPLTTNQEQFVGSEMSMGGAGTGARLKRADEEIVFGNHQNKARVMSKKSDTSLTPALGSVDLDKSSSPGELDAGSEVVVHKEVPIEKDLAERADAARKDLEDEDKIADAMEAAMSVVDDKAAEQKEKEEEATDTAVNPIASSEQLGEAVSVEDSPAADVSSPESFDSENIAASNHAVDDVTANALPSDADDDIKDLLKATAAHQEQTSNDVQEGGSDEESSIGQQVNAQADHDTQPGAAISTIPQDMYMEYFNPYRVPYRHAWFDLFRRRRSLAGSKQGAGRRIKRDLLDDIDHDPELSRYLYGSDSDTGMAQPSNSRYSVPSDDLETGEDALLSGSYDYIPVSENDADDLYSQLEQYLEQELQRREGANRLSRILGLSPLGDESVEDEDDNAFGRSYGNDRNLLDQEEEEMPMVDESNPMYSLDMRYPSENPYDYLSKRDDEQTGDYGYNRPAMATRKRYFFPFADEPETHWGAFVPEKRSDNGRSVYLDDSSYQWRQPEYSAPTKRDYNEAIHRLQRLAMALSDNRGPYFNEIVEDQPLKK